MPLPNKFRCPILIALCLPTFSQLQADAVYKSVDANGQVTYSSTPPAESVDSQAIPLAPEPTEAQRQEALKVERRLDQAATRLLQDMEKTRAARKSGINNAQAGVDAARQALEQAKIKQDSDYQPIVTGARVLKESYFERVRKAEEQLAKTEKTQTQARRDAR